MHIDEQIGVKGIAKECSYKNSHNRNNFLKNIKDQWQNEFRLFWAHPNEVEIDLPAGLARPLPKSLKLIQNYGFRRVIYFTIIIPVCLTYYEVISVFFS